MNNFKLMDRAELKAKIEDLSKQNQILKDTLARNKKEKHDFLMRTLNTMGDPVFVKDAESRLLLVNDAFCKTFKLSREEIIGKTLAENVPPEERESFLAIDRQVIKDGKENINEEPLTVESGDTHIIATKKNRFTDKDNNHFLVGIIRDITKRFKAEKALKENEAKLAELNESKDKMFSIIAHDLRGPMGSLVGLSEILQSEEDDLNDLEKKEYLKMIHRSIVSTKSLLDNLLKWANCQRGNIRPQKKPFRLNTCVDEICLHLKGISQSKAISLQNKIDPELTLNSDYEIISTVIRNLVGNAIKFSHEGGAVRINAKINGDHMNISVSDDGVGMSKDQAAGLFTIRAKSTRGTANEKGSGLGLMLCKDFVELLGGQIKVSSELGHGSCFQFTIPVN